jgi:hypothetical protein
MAFVIQAHIEDHTLSATTETAKEAFSKAVEWQAVHKLTCVTISDGVRSFSITDFASVFGNWEHGPCPVRPAAQGRIDEALSDLAAARSSAIPYAGRLGADPKADPRG